MSRKPWDLAFTAAPEEVWALRRIMRTHLGLWGLHEAVDAAQLCVSELVSNVITHVGLGTPATLAVSMSGTYVRIEVHDPDTRALPTLLDAATDSESGRGMALVDAVADRWGVQLRADRKMTWCELATGLCSPDGHSGGTRVTRVEAMLSLYEAAKLPRPASRNPSPLSMVVAEATAVAAIADLLHWLRAHGCDPDEALDRAQTHFEAELEGCGGRVAHRSSV
ncbi:ATP-binding protein [Streptomyces sp. PSKA54]|uniref:ATP-binding protein n=1 Tax=Streptomyces himalayensis subsp. aureolus TaxID=2758039 RepID=A0A7W2CWK5_9ACTN|nr:ATP-binding protein [Streptomyces himalayensis]MBA4860433.1 ATP-binding protein [Streptomyces himalayensis subsp. aureolus]